MRGDKTGESDGEAKLELRGANGKHLEQSKAKARRMKDT